MARKGQALVVRAWGSLHPETGMRVHRNQVFTPTKDLVQEMADAAAGLYQVNRENDELTRALGNLEHGGRVRGRGVGVSWKEGFSQHEDRYGYKSRKRKKDWDGDRIGNLEHEVAGMRKIVEDLQHSSSRRQEDPAALDNSQRRSSVASTELLQPDITAPRYPVDYITEARHCELMTKCANLLL